MYETHAEPLVEETPAAPRRFEQAGRWLGRIAGIGVVATSGVVIGAFHDPVEGRLGPHQVEATATLDSYLTADFGPFDSLDIPVDLPLGAGVDVVIKGNVRNEIDVEDYARFLSDPSEDTDALKEKFRAQAIENALLSAGAFMLLRLALGKEGRKIAWDRMQTHRVPYVVGVLALGAGSLLLTSDVAKSEYSSPVDNAFDGTILEGARANGVIMDKLLNEAAPEVFALIEDNENFYNAALTNLNKTAEKGRLLTSNKQQTTVLFYTDNHCNLGMARVIGGLEKVADAELLFDGGDTTMGGTEFEAQCLSIISDATKADIVFAAGNHDSDITEKQAKARGFHVLNGERLTIHGLTIIGDEDPNRSEFNKQRTQKGKETTRQASLRLAKEACATDKQIDVLLVHDKSLAEATAKEGCADITISGDAHRYSAQKHASGTVQLVGGTTGGKKSGGSTFGPLRAPAKLYLIQFDRGTGSYERHQEITINTDASVEIGTPTFAGAQS